MEEKETELEPIKVLIEIDEEKLKRVKKLLDDIRISAQEVKELFKQIF